MCMCMHMWVRLLGLGSGCMKLTLNAENTKTKKMRRSIEIFALKVERGEGNKAVVAQRYHAPASRFWATSSLS